MNQSNYRKFLTASLSTAVVATVVPGFTASAAENQFQDVSEKAFYYEAVQAFVGKGVVQGYPDGTFKPGQNVTRGEAAKMIADTFGFQTSNARSSFNDVNADAWYYGSVSVLAKKGILNGYKDGSFKPNQPITRAEIAKIIVEAYETIDSEDAQSVQFSDVAKSAWYRGFVSALAASKVTTGKTATTFAPNDFVTRGEAVTFLHRSEDVNTIDAITKTTVTINGQTYTLADNVKGIINPVNAVALTNAKIDFKATDDQITDITYLSLVENGQATDEEFAGNVVLDGGNGTISGNLSINANYATVKNINVQGDLFIGKQLQNDFYSENLVVEGETTINGGDDNTVVFNNGTFNKVNVDKKGVRVKVDGTTTIDDMSVVSDSTISGDAKLGKVVIAGMATSVILDADVADLQLAGANALTIAGAGHVDELTVNGKKAVTLDMTGTIGKLIANQIASLTLNQNVKIDELQLPENSKAEDIVSDFASFKDNIGKISIVGSTDSATNSGSSGGGSSSGGGGGSSSGGGGSSSGGSSPTSPSPTDTTAPIIDSISFNDVIANFNASDRTFNANLSNVTSDVINWTVDASEASTATVTVDQLGTIGTFNLTAGTNQLLNVNFADLDPSTLNYDNINFTDVYNAIVASGVSNQAIYDAVDLGSIINEVKGLGLRQDIFAAIDLAALTQSFSALSAETQADIYGSVDLQAVTAALLNDTSISQTQLGLAIAGGILVIKNDLSQASQDKLAVLQVDQSVIDEVFSVLAAADAQTKADFYAAIDFNGLFSLLETASSTTVQSIYEAVNFGQAFTTLRDATDVNKAAVIDDVFAAVNMKAIFTALDNANVDRASIMQYIDLSAIFTATGRSQGLTKAIYDILSKLDRNPDDNTFTIGVTLTDQANNETTYTINLGM